MILTPRKTASLVSRLVIVLSAVFSAINLFFIVLDTPRMMPMALTMTGYLSKTGVSLSAEHDLPFFALYGLVISGIVCVVLLLSAILAGINRGWLVVGALVFVADCIGIALLVVSNGYRSGYWFEIVGHAVVLIALIAALCTMPRKNKMLSQ